jgi:hypothetical protein
MGVVGTVGTWVLWVRGYCGYCGYYCGYCGYYCGYLGTVGTKVTKILPYLTAGPEKGVLLGIFEEAESELRTGGFGEGSAGEFAGDVEACGSEGTPHGPGH